MARSDRRTAELLLKITADKRSLQQASRSLNAFDRTLNDIGRNKGFNQLAASASKAVSEGNNLRKVMTRLRADLVKVGASESEVGRVVRQFVRLREEAERASVGTRRGAALQEFGREARLQLPAIPIPGTGISSEQVARVAEVGGRLNLTFKDLAIGGLAAVGSIAAISIAFKQFQATIGAVQKTLEEITKARVEVAGFLTDATTDVTQAEIDRLKLERDRLKEQRLQAAGDRTIQQEAAARGDALSQLIGGIGNTFQVGPIGDAIKRVDELDGKIAAANVQIEAYEQAIGDQTLAINDAAEAEQQRNQALQETILRQTNLQRQFLGENNLDAFDSRLDNLKRERDLLREVVSNLEPGSEAFETLNKELQNANADLSTMAILIRPVVEELDAVRQAEERRSKAIKDSQQALRDEIKLEAQRAKAIQGLADFAANFAARIQDIQRRAGQAIGDAAFKRDADIAEARREQAINEAEAVRKAGLERVKIVEQSEQAINRILRRGRRAELVAIQDRDAIALEAARARKDEELRTEQESRDDRLREQKRNLAEELRQIRRAGNERLRTIQRQFNETVRRTQLTAQRTIALETEKFQREFQLRVRNASQTLNLTQQEIAQRLTLYQKGATSVVGITAQMWQQMINLGISALSGLGSASASRQTIPTSSPSLRGTGGSGFTPTQFHRGGVVTRSGQAMLLAGEMVINPRQGQGGPAININGMGMSPRQVGRAVERALEDYNAGRRDAAPAGVFGG